MDRRTLGRSGLEVSTLCFGGNVFGWTADEARSFELLDAFVEAGGNFIDTADVYSLWVPGNQGGESETIIGKWLKQSGKREKVIIASKVGSEMGPDARGLSRAYILRAVEDSLRRLQTDYIDLYQSHRDDESTPQEETLATYAELISQGKIRAIGASNFKADRLWQALQISQQHGYPRYESLQPLYNLYDRAGYEQELAPLCEEQGVGVISYYSLASGFLSGKYRSEADLGQSPRGAGVRRYLDARGFRILDALDQLARRYDATPPQISLAWLLTRPALVAPIASVTTRGQLKQLVKGISLKLDADAVELLNQASTY